MVSQPYLAEKSSQIFLKFQTLHLQNTRKTNKYFIWVCTRKGMVLRVRREVSLVLLILFFLFVAPFSASGEESAHKYSLKRYQSIQNVSQMMSYKFSILQNQVFEVYFENFGKVRFVPALDEVHKKIVIFLADYNGEIVYRTDKIESNSLQNINDVDGIVAVSFQDVNGNGLKDIILICRCVNESDTFKDMPYKIGDVLFQSSNGFYSDSRISEAINSFSMNQNIATIAAFAGGKQSKEFLYTSKTLTELKSKGFNIIPEHSFWAKFEAFGQAGVILGSYEMGGLRTLMLYIIDLSGNICARIECMKGYDDCVGLLGVTFEDIDGDGLRDILVLAEYQNCDGTNFPPQFSTLKSDFYIAFQKDYWFERNFIFEREFSLENPIALDDVIEKAKKYFREKMQF